MGFARDVVNGLTGRTAADAATDAASIQSESLDRAIDNTNAATAEGQRFLAPFTSLGQEGLSLASFLTDPNEQFDFLRNNPLFNLALDNANTETNQVAASRGRLSAGDTLQQLTDNVLLKGIPLIQDQKRSIADLLNFGGRIATTQANTAINQASDVSDLITTQGAVDAGGEIGAANATTAGANNLLNSALLAGGIFRQPAAA